jgi:glycine cleavage system H protein
VTEVNDAVVSSPELVNDDPFGAGWLIKVSFSDVPALLDADAYTALTGE